MVHRAMSVSAVRLGCRLACALASATSFSAFYSLDLATAKFAHPDRAR